MTAIGDYDDAMQFFQKAIEIRNKQGEEAANQLGLLYLCIARVYSLQQKWDETERNLNKSENLFVRTIGAEKHYMAQ
jgi:tetratricopeptide (TPR) repeat protein